MTNKALEARIALERRVVRELIRHMKAYSWLPYRVNDGGDMVPCFGKEAAAMEAVFAVDESSIRFAPAVLVNEYMAAREADRPAAERTVMRDACREAEHGVLIVLGNDGWDAISDWNYSEGDADGFNAAMNAYMDSPAFLKLQG